MACCGLDLLSKNKKIAEHFIIISKLELTANTFDLTTANIGRANGVNLKKNYMNYGR